MRVLVITGLALLAMLPACMSEKGMPEPKGLVCDSVVSYAADLVPLIESQCQPCHSGPDPSGGIDFSNYEIVKSKADDGSLKRTVFDQKSMPQPGSGFDLTEEERRKFACWVSNGAPNN